MSLANRDNLRPSFLSHITLYSFFYLIVPVRFVSTKLNRSGKKKKKGHSSFAPVLAGKKN